MLVLEDVFMHYKNKEGLIRIFEYLKMDYKFGNISDIDKYDVIYMPSNPIDTSKYPNKKFIFGPHFSTFPMNKMNVIKNVHNNSVYIQPSVWSKDIWEPHLKENKFTDEGFQFSSKYRKI